MRTKKAKDRSAAASEAAPKTWIQIRAFRALLLAAETFRDAHKELFIQADLSLPEFDILATLGNTQGMRMKDIASRMMSSSSTSNVTRLCSALENRGLVTRRRSPESDREVIASLTEQGRKLFEELFPKTTAFVRDYANERLSEKELGTLYELLVRLRGMPDPS